ncbi:MAG: hypothetical protein ACLFP2_02195 [Candidatus Woesearchaeota archaeon]
MKNIISRMSRDQQPCNVNSKYFRKYYEQLELFHLINNRAHLFFRSAA